MIEHFFKNMGEKMSDYSEWLKLPLPTIYVRPALPSPIEERKSGT